MAAIDEPLVWLRGEVKTPPFSQAARVEAGVLLRQLQGGAKLGLPHSRPMPAISARCHELRIVDERATWRSIYRLDDDAAVIVDVFSKKTRQSPGQVIADCRRRLGQYDESTRWTIESGASMEKRKRARLEATGWTVGTPREFLGLSEEEVAFIEFKLALSRTLRALRTAQELSQVEVAKRLRSSQSRVAKMEASDPSVSVDLLVKSLFKLGVQPGDIAKALRSRRKVPAV